MNVHVECVQVGGVKHSPASVFYIILKNKKDRTCTGPYMDYVCCIRKECIQHVFFDLKGPNCKKKKRGFFFVSFSIAGQVERDPKT